MRLESALNTGREGITAHGQAIAVVGDNISNANTVGYKNQKAIFADLLGQTPGDRVAEVVSGAGDGVTIREIRSNFEVGPIQGTGRDLDVALSGSGFFQVGEVATPQLTRSGQFAIDGEGFLVTSFGLPVLGYTGGDAVNLGKIDMRKVDLDIVPTTEAQLYGNLNSSATTSTPPANALSFQEINTTAAHTNIISVYDTLGERHEVVFAYYRNGINSWTVQAYANGSDVGQAADQPVLLGQTDLTFDANGRPTAESLPTAVLNVNATWSNGSAPSTIGADLSAFSQFAGATLVTNFTQNGQGVGEITGYEINGQGVISARLTNGLTARIGSLSIATVTNQDGLVRNGTSTYVATDKAGVVTSGTAGTGARSNILSQSLEYSNVDLAGQFVELVVLQRAYAANSKVISTASDVIKDTISLVR
jgi:flagellar hook protein FlgE